MNTWKARILVQTISVLILHVVVSAGPVLNILEPDFDFGCVGIDFTVYHEFQITNDGDQEIKIDSLYPTCDCSTVRFLDSLVQPGDTVTFLLRFNTKDYYGPTSRTVRLVSENLEDPVRLIKYNSIVGQWPYGLKPDPISLFFLPNREVINVTLTNPVLETLEIDETSSYANIVDVKYSSQKVGKGGKLNLEVRPDPTLSNGTHHSNFSISFKTPEGTSPVKLTFPVKVVKY